VADSRYKLRPEYVESLFYAWRVTGEARYREWAWEAFENMEKWCKTEWGFAGLRDVMHVPPDYMALKDDAATTKEKDAAKKGDAATSDDNTASRNKDTATKQDKKKSAAQKAKLAGKKREIGPRPRDNSNIQNQKKISPWLDESESFWGAETLKYLWLTFEDVGVGSLDQWIFSTEGHMFRRPP